MFFLVFLNDINDALNQDHLNMKNTLYCFWFALNEKKLNFMQGETSKMETAFLV